MAKAKSLLGLSTISFLVTCNSSRSLRSTFQHQVRLLSTSSLPTKQSPLNPTVSWSVASQTTSIEDQSPWKTSTTKLLAKVWSVQRHRSIQGGQRTRLDCQLRPWKEPRPQQSQEETAAMALLFGSHWIQKGSIHSGCRGVFVMKLWQETIWQESDVSCSFWCLGCCTGPGTICSVRSEEGRHGNCKMGDWVNKKDWIVKGGQMKGTKFYAQSFSTSSNRKSNILI